jgi:Ni,Fe-hydrogenase maturation factor
MMKAYLLLLVLSAATLQGNAQNKVKLDSRASVTFPGKTEQMQGATGPILYSTLDKDNKVTGMATVIDATQFGVDSAMIAANYNNSAFVDLILQGLLGQYPGVEVVSRKKIAKSKQMGYELTLQKDKPDETVPYKNLYAQVFFAGSNIYALTVLVEDGAETTEDKERFFNSLKID